MAQGEPRLSAYLSCVADVLRVAEIEFGADAGVAQRRDHALVVGDAVAVEHGDDHRAGLGLGVELAERGQRRLQPRHADGEAGRRHRLAAEARHEAVITPAAADRAEAHRAAFLVLGLEGQFNFEDRAGVIFEAADDGGVDANSVLSVAGRVRSSSQSVSKFVDAVQTQCSICETASRLEH